MPGRFTSPDPLMASAIASQPQSWNRYTYCINNPLRYIDPTGLFINDYYINRDGTINIYETPDQSDRFYTENSSGIYVLQAVLTRNADGLVQFPASGTGFNRYGTIDAGGVDRVTGETVGVGDHYLQPVVAAALFGVINVLNDTDGFNNLSLGDMSSSNGSDPWQPGGGHHRGHGHFGRQSGANIDFRYLNNDGRSFWNTEATTSPNFSIDNNQTLYDTAETFGFTRNYQGLRSTLNGPQNIANHDDHGHLGFVQANANIVRGYIPSNLIPGFTALPPFRYRR